MSDGSQDDYQEGFDVFTSTDESDTQSDQTEPATIDSTDSTGTESSPQKPTDENPVTALPELSGDSFNEYWFAETARRNEEENHPERNDPSHSWPIGRVEPHQLGNCHRQWFYQWLNAPLEDTLPHGIFAVGHYMEEEIVEPWLRDFFEPEYDIDNAVHVSVDITQIPVGDTQLTVPVDTGVPVEIPDRIGYNQPNDQPPVTDSESISLTVAGSTDPAICDTDTGEIIALTEVKSTGSIGYVTEPKRMHEMQIHAYMKALNIENGYVIYIDRDNLLDPKVFEVEFDDTVWESVVDWAETATSYAASGTLPPADPPEGWMCKYCDYSNRCGEGRSNLSEDMGAKGFVPGYTEYPRHMVTDHLTAYPDVKLTPSLALKFPDLTRDHDVTSWVCPECTASFEYTDERFSAFENRNFDTPKCPACKNVFDTDVYLSVE